MTVIDPFLDAEPGASAGARLGGPRAGDAAPRHPRRAAGRDRRRRADRGGRARRADAREQVERIAAAARTLAGAGRRAARRGARPGDGGRRPVDLDGFLRARPPPPRRRGARARPRPRGRGRRPACPTACRLDRIALARIVDNLVGNAIKFSDAGTVRLSVARDAGRQRGLPRRRRRPGPRRPHRRPRRPAPARRRRASGSRSSARLPTGLGGEVSLGNRPPAASRRCVRFPAGGGRRGAGRRELAARPTSRASGSCSPRTIRPTRWSRRRCCARSMPR